MSKDIMKDIKKYVNERDKAICECWDKNSIEPLEEFIKSNITLYDIEFIKMWNKALMPVKRLTLCKMTLSCSSKKVIKYHKNAIEFLKEYRKDYES